MTKTEMKRRAQEELMDGIAVKLGYWEEGEHNWPDGWEDWPEARKQDYRDIMWREADRVARLFGYEKAWGA